MLEIIIGAAVLLPLSAASAAATIKFNYYIERERRAERMIAEYDTAYVDLEEIFTEGRMAALGSRLEESTDFLSILARAADDYEVPLARVEESPEIGDEPVSLSSTESQRMEVLQERLNELSLYTPSNTIPEASTPDEEDSNTRRYNLRRRRPKNIIAYALAQEAYYNFGARPRSEANNLITRRWMRDRMDTYKDVRHIDRASIIDIALVLSFLPSLDAREVENLAQTYTFMDRSTTTPLFRLFQRLLPNYCQQSSRTVG